MTAAIALTFLVSTAVVWTLRSVALRHGLLNRPDARSAHVIPTPRLGGVGIGLGFICGAALLSAHASPPIAAWTVLAGTLGVGLLGLVDDLRPIPAAWRLAFQLLAAAAVVWANGAQIGRLAGESGIPEALVAALAVVWITWLTNLFNFMDGIDGLASGQAIIAALGLAAGSWMCGTSGACALLVLLAAACAGFLLFNFPRASIFMGDAGSTTIGFFFGCVPLLSEGRELSPAPVGLALAMFVLDATSTLVRRVLRGERWYEAHRTHWYQRPLAWGTPHRRITLVAWAAMVPCAVGAAAWPAMGRGGRVAAVALAAFEFFGLVLLIRRRDKREHPVR